MSYKFSKHLGGHGLLHTPEGVRDIYNEECEKKLAIQDRMHHVLKLYGFRDIQTPSFEFFDIFNKERGTVVSKEMYKFFDREGNTLVLRPDMTPSVARCAAKYYKDEQYPIRLCYMGSTFINNSSYQGKLKETTQLGAELFNDATSDADAEMIALTIECLLQAGLTEFQVEIGHAKFLPALLEEAEFCEEEMEQIKELIESKNVFGVEELISKKKLSKQLKELIIKLPDLFGDIEIIHFAKERIKNEEAKGAISHLEKLYDILTTYGLETYITFDLGMFSKYNYYTDIIFQAYTYGNGEPIVKGGRYDNLVAQFGKNAPAIGFAIVVDQLMLALDRQKLDQIKSQKHTLILYSPEYRKIAIELARQFRSTNMQIELTRKSSKEELDNYKEYAERNGVGGILYLEKEDSVQVIDLLKQTSQFVRLSELIEK